MRDIWDMVMGLLAALVAALPGLWDSTLSALAGAEESTREWRQLIVREVESFGQRLRGIDLHLSAESATVGAVLLVFLSLPSLASAFVDRRAPVVGLILLGAGVFLGWWTEVTYPAPWTFDRIVRDFVQIIANIIR